MGRKPTRARIDLSFYPYPRQGITARLIAPGFQQDHVIQSN